MWAKRQKARSTFIYRISEFIQAILSIFVEFIGFISKPLIEYSKQHYLVLITTLVGFSIISVLLLSINKEEKVFIQTEIKARDSIIIGAAISLTGKFENQGNEMRNGYETAIAIINESGGIPINGVAHNLKLAIYDDESNKLRVAEITELMLISDPPVALLAPYSSSLARPMATVARREKIPMIAAIASTEGMKSEAKQGVYLLQSPPYKHLVTAAELLLENFKARRLEPLTKKKKTNFAGGTQPRVLLASSPDPHSLQVLQGVVDVLKKDEQIVVEAIDLSLAEEEFAKEKASLSNADAIFVAAYANGAAKLMKTIATDGINIPYVAMTHCDIASIQNKEPTASQGALCALHWQSEAKFKGSQPILIADFLNRYYERYGRKPTHRSAAAAAAIIVIASALKKSDQLQADFQQTIAATNIDTIYGPVNFDDNGFNTAKPMVLSQINQSRYTPVAPRNIAVADLIFIRPRLASN